MPHFKNFHGPVFSKISIKDLGIDQETITATNRFDDLGIDQETITADKYDDFIVLGSDKETINARGGDDQIHFNDELTILAQEGTDTLLLKAGLDADTINANEPLDQLFDAGNFGETPPVDISYELADLDEMGQTPIDAMTYTLE